MKRIQSTLSRALGRRLQPLSAPRTRFSMLAIAVLICTFFVVVPTVFVASGNMQKGVPPPPQGKKGPDNGITLVPQVGQCVAFAETIPVRNFGPAEPASDKESILKPRGDGEVNQKNTERVKLVVPGTGGKGSSGIQNSTLKEPKIPAPIVSFDGNISNDNQTAFGFRVEPPDTNGDVGPNHYVQTTNLLVGIFNKATGALVVPKFKMSSLFAAVGAPCATRDDGDPIVLYDQLADRWLISQFCTALQSGNTSQLIGISKTGDPTGAWFVYNFRMPNNKFNDYPHFGVWPDAYYMTDNQFNQAGTAFLGAGAFAFDRTKMLAGDPTATFIYFDEFLIDQSLGGQLPTDLDGFVLPPVGTPNLFMEFRATEFGDPLDALRIFAFHPDFVNPMSSTFTQVGTDLALGAFDANAPGVRAAIEQPPPATSSTFVDAIADRLMNRLTCRILSGGVQSYVGNFTVNVSGGAGTTAATYQAGIKWFELRRNSGTGAMSVNQDGIYAPGAGDGVNGRNIWMGSVNQDNEGNIGLGFSASSLTLFPSVIYTGRLVGDPLGTLPQGEATIVAGGGSQQDNAARWGDYSAMSVDPVDDCTFWYTQEYYAASGQFAWNTRIGSFRVNTNCVASQRGTISGTVTNCNTGLPIQNAVVTTPDGYVRQTDAAGTYSITAAPGTYTVKITAAGGFGTCTTNSVVVTNGGNTVVNCCLAPSAIIASAGATLISESCTPMNGVLDPGELVTVSFCVQNTGAANTTNLVGTLANTGGVTGASGPQNYGVVVASGPAVCRDFTFTAAGMCGGTVTASIQFQDGASDLGTLTYTFTLGTLNTVFSENFDGVTAPALPAGWVATQGTNVTGAPLWVTSSAGTPAPPADTAPNAIFSTDPSNILDNRIDTPAIAIASATARLNFRHNFNLESTFDGGVVEISNPTVNAGAFQDIITAGGSFVAGTQAYTGPISTAFGSPIAGRQAFSGSSGGAFVTTSINLPASAAGQMIKIRFRMGSDNSVAAVGWRVDTVTITDGFVCSQTCSTPCAENFDMVTAPALPAMWSATVGATCANTARWVTVNTTSDTAPNSAFVNDPNCISDERLDSKPFPIVSASAQLTFRRNNNLETNFDGMALEISNPTINAGAFQDIIAAGGSFVNGGYNGTISVNFGNPLAGRMAWTGNSAGFVTTTVNLPANANGQSIILRWRRGSDSSVSAVGAFIDTITISGSNCGATCTGITCPANITTSNDPNQCGAVVNYPAPTTAGTCGPVTCAPASGSFFPKGTTTVTCSSTGPPPQTCMFTVTVNDTQPPTITCPANVTQSNDLNQCGAVVTYPAPAVSDNCPGVGAPTCSPASGSFFPKGTTTVTCSVSDASNNSASCSFTVTVNDTQPPTITCPPNQTAVTDQNACPSPQCTVVNFPPPVVTDNCPMVTFGCNPMPGSCFAVGVTTVTCTATDMSGNTASCSFTVTVFDVALQDDSNPAIILLWNSITGQYRFCCNGVTYSGFGKPTVQGCVYTLTTPNALDRRIVGRVDKAVHSGTASLQAPPGTTRCTITDRDTRNDTNLTSCQ